METNSIQLNSNTYAHMSNNGSKVSSREQEILHLVSCGLRSKEISSSLFISPHTVHSHIKNLKSKLDARNTAELVRIGFELNLLSPKSKFEQTI